MPPGEKPEFPADSKLPTPMLPPAPLHLQCVSFVCNTSFDVDGNTGASKLTVSGKLKIFSTYIKIVNLSFSKCQVAMVVVNVDSQYRRIETKVPIVPVVAVD